VLDTETAYLRDYGSFNDHYNYDFYIFDVDDEVRLYMELFSLGTEGFQDGTFGKDPEQNYWGGDYLTLYGGMLRIEGAGDIDCVSGTVIVKELGELKYSITFDYVTNDDGKTIKGNYTGLFEYVDNTRIAK
jgi:hypothetical protein